MSGLPAILFLISTVIVLLSGFPVAGGLLVASIGFALAASALGAFDVALLYAIAPRIFGVLTNTVLLAVPMFVFMGLVLEKSGLADAMFRAVSQLFSERPAGLLGSVTIVGILLAASTGIVGASVVTLGLLALPALLRSGVSPPLAAGSVAAAGTLGQLIPPSIVLIVLGDQMSNAYQKAQIDSGNFVSEPVTVADLFAGALVPGVMLAALYIVYQLCAVGLREVPERPTQNVEKTGNPVLALAAPLVLIIAVLGSILVGYATPTEAAAIGAISSLLLGTWKQKEISFLRPALEESVHLVAMIFFIVIAASVFSLVFRGLGGDALVENLLEATPGGTWGALAGVMILLFFLGFFLEFLEITYMVVPLVAPVLLALPMADGSAMSPVWLGVLIALNLQTSFLTPPFGVSLFYLRSVTPDTISTLTIYRGVAPYIVLQLAALALVMAFPALATWLPALIYG